MPARARRPNDRRTAWRLAAALAVAVVLFFTLREDELVTWSHLTGRNLVPLRHHLAALRCVLDDCGNAQAALHYLLVDVVGNVLLFVPVGLTLTGASRLRSRFARLAAATALAAALSLAIELVQLWMPTRASDVDDVLFNTLGALVGAVAALPFVRRARG